MRCIAALLLTFSALPAPLLAASGCGSEVSAYEAAKQSFSADAEATYHVTVPELQFAPADAGKDFLAEKLVVGEIDFSVLSASSRQARTVADELMQMLRALKNAGVNPLFLKRREMPQVFAKGAELSRCLSALERAEFDRITAVLSAKAAKDETRRTECIAAKASSAEAKTKQAELDATIADLVRERGQSEDPATQDGLAVGIALLETTSQLISAVDAMECAFADGELVADALGTVLGLAVTVSFSMNARKAVQKNLELVFGEELDFGYFDMSEATE